MGPVAPTAQDPVEQPLVPIDAMRAAQADDASLSRPRIGEVLSALGAVDSRDVALGRMAQDLGDERLLGQILITHEAASQEQVDLAAQLQDSVTEAPAPVSAPAPVRSPARRNVESLALFLLAGFGVVVITVLADGTAGWYGIAALSVLAVKLAASSFYRPKTSAPPTGLSVAVVVPFYNEDPEAFRRCLRSVLEQSWPVQEIWAVDDGSTQRACLEVAQDVLAGRPGAVVHRLEQNAGKRHAQSYAFARTTCDIVVTIDSDTVLDRAAVHEGLRPFVDEEVMAVTGNVRALNHRKNLLTRLIDLRYSNAFLFERAAYSVAGSVICCCGSLSLFRGDLVRTHLDEYTNQTFLGIPVQYGDDRRLTQYALSAGKVLIQDTAVAYTTVPERLDHFARQQIRWNKSFFRESQAALRRFGPTRWPFWISLAELVGWVAFTTALVLALYVRPAVQGEAFPWHYLAYAVVLAYARNVRYFGRPGVSGGYQAATFAMAPLYAMLHFVMLTPLRVWALLTLRRGGWGTRREVEVVQERAASEPAAPRHAVPGERVQRPAAVAPVHPHVADGGTQPVRTLPAPVGQAPARLSPRPIVLRPRAALNVLPGVPLG